MKSISVYHDECVDCDELSIVIKSGSVSRKLKTSCEYQKKRSVCDLVFQLSVLWIWMWDPAEEDSSGGFMMFQHTGARSLHMEDAEETTTDSDHLRNVTICVWNT